MARVIPASFFSALARMGQAALHVALPPLCVACAAPCETPHGFCATCWKSFSFITPPACACCGLPFAFAQTDAPAMLCGACLQEPPHYHSARAALVYDEASRGLILSFKHHDRTDVVPAFARLMAGAGEGVLARADVLVPVPLHPWRLFLRRYNQSALLAQALAKMADKPVLCSALRRIRATPSQGHLSRAQRFKNVQGAFVVPQKARAALAGKTVLLVDDVMTTGATASACAAVLGGAGAAKVDVLTLARAVREAAY